MHTVSYNPYNGEALATYPYLTAQAIDEKLHQAEKGFAEWRKLSFTQRSALMLSLAEILRNKQEQLATLITLEMGKIVSEARAEIEKCAGQCEYYAHQAENLLQSKPLPSEATQSYLCYQPLGCILGIMPWNFPFWQFFRYAVPVLMAGNVTVLKHASNVFGCALAIQEAFDEAGFPKGVMQTLMIGAAQANELIADRRIAGVTLTGSGGAGAAVAATAGKYIKKTVLELGGSDPFVVLDDADLQTTIAAAVKSRMANAGQVCIAAKRFIVTPRIYPDFLHELSSAVKTLRQGNGLHENTQMGPLAKSDIVQDLFQQQQQSVVLGATIVTGGNFEENNYQPTVLAEVTPKMPVFAEETFGPLAAVIRAKNAEDAIELANRSIYGLGASIWSSDIEKAGQLALEIEAGSVYINEPMRSDFRFPLGGIKQSGYGRELQEPGIKEFCNTKTVYVK